MTLNEIFLVAAFAFLILILPLLVRRIRQPHKALLNLTSGLILVTWGWLFYDGGNFAFKVLITIVVISGINTTIKELRE